MACCEDTLQDTRELVPYYPTFLRHLQYKWFPRLQVCNQEGLISIIPHELRQTSVQVHMHVRKVVCSSTDSM